MLNTPPHNDGPPLPLTPLSAAPLRDQISKSASTVLSPTDRFSVQAELEDNFPSMRLWFEIDRAILSS